MLSYADHLSISSKVGSVEHKLVISSLCQCVLEHEAADVLPHPIQVIVLVGVSTRDYPHDNHSFSEDKID